MDDPIALQLRAETAEALLEEEREENERLRVEIAHLRELLNEKGGDEVKEKPKPRDKVTKYYDDDLDDIQFFKMLDFGPTERSMLKKMMERAEQDRIRYDTHLAPRTFHPVQPPLKVDLMRRHEQRTVDVRVKLGHYNVAADFDLTTIDMIKRNDSRGTGALVEVCKHMARKLAAEVPGTNAERLTDDIYRLTLAQMRKM